LVLAASALITFGVRHDVIVRRHNHELAASAAKSARYARQVERHLDVSRLRAARQALDAGNPVLAQELLNALVSHDDQHDLRGFAWGWLRREAQRDVTVLWTHAENANVMAIGPDGRTLAVGDFSGSIMVGDMHGLGQRATLRGHTEVVDRLVFCPDGRRLASADSTHAEILIWDLASRSRLGRVRLPAGQRVTALAFMAGGDMLGVCSAKFDDPNESAPELHLFSLRGSATNPQLTRRIVTAGRVGFDGAGGLIAVPLADHRLVLVDGSTGEPEESLSCAGIPWSPTFSPDGSRLVAYCAGTAVVWDVPSGRELDRFVIGPAQYPFVFSPDGSTLAAIGIDGDVHLKDLARNESRTIVPDELKRELRSVEVAFAPDGRTLVTKSWGRPGGASALKVWDVATGRGRALLSGRAAMVSGLKYAPDGHAVLALAGQAVLKYHQHSSGEANPTFPVNHGGKWIWSVAFGPDGQTLATGGDDEKIVLTRSSDPADKVILGGHTEAVDAISFSPDGHAFASGSQESSNNLKLWDLNSNCVRADLRGHTDKVRSVEFDRSGALLVSSSFDRTVRIWDARTGGAIRSLEGHTDRVHRAVFSPDGRLIASSSDDGTVRLWDALAGRPKRVLSHRREVFSVAFSPDGRILASGDSSGLIILRDVHEDQVVARIRSEISAVRALAFSPDGRTLAGAGDDGTVRLWDPVTAQELLSLSGHRAQVNGLAFAPDGHTLASVSHDGIVRIWRE
jgi:WD40 repeat protein